MTRLNKIIFIASVLCGIVTLTAVIRRNSVLRPEAADGMNVASSHTVIETPAVVLPQADPNDGGDSWAVRWRGLKSLPKDAGRDAEELALIRELAAIDPLRAISFAVTEKDLGRRDQLLRAVMQMWGTTNPEAAIEWATSQNVMESSEAIAAAFRGAVQYPDNAIQLAENFSARDPGRALDYGSYLIAALSDAGDYNRAAAYASGADGDIRVDLLNAAFSNWAANDPVAAMNAVNAISDADIRRDAFDAAISRWADNDPKSAAEFALTLDSQQDRSFALSAALRQWAADSPIDAANWLAKTSPSPELDQAVAAIASNPVALNDSQTAIGWADSITDTSLKTRVLATILNAWAATDPDAARDYANSVANLSSAQRAILLSAFDPEFTPISYLP